MVVAQCEKPERGVLLLKNNTKHEKPEGEYLIKEFQKDFKPIKKIIINTLNSRQI